MAKRTEKLAELLQLAQMYSMLNAPQQQEAELDARQQQQNLASMLQLVGLMDQMEANKAQLGLREQALGVERQNAELNAQAMVLKELIGDPTVSLDLKMQLAGGLPGMAEVAERYHREAVRAEQNKWLPIIETIYRDFAKNPKLLQENLATAGIPWGTEAIDNLDWPRLNALTWTETPDVDQQEDTIRQLTQDRGISTPQPQEPTPQPPTIAGWRFTPAGQNALDALLQSVLPQPFRRKQPQPVQARPRIVEPTLAPTLNVNSF